MDVPKEPSDPLLTRPAAQPAHKNKFINSDVICCGIISISMLILTIIGFASLSVHYSNGSSHSYQSGITLIDKHGTQEISTDELMKLIEDHKQKHAEQPVIKDVTQDVNSTFSEPITENPQNSAKCERRVVYVFDLDSTDDFKKPTDEQLSMLPYIILFPLELHSNGTISIRSGCHLEIFEALVKRAQVHGVGMVISTVELKEKIMEHIRRDKLQHLNIRNEKMSFLGFLAAYTAGNL